ncbi:YifB family Mg chelatase-like AAA ATPase [Devriesea agamarum]|uniref:YifB family Mg chelatase-like AAA ATPase n=1 Tax=Devriesea agamarum TaxID=472569 RepID=UPI00071D8587|nr:YifB family Mg chelatase-like AAA ATPase [Devriesea agamarum]
MSIGRTRSVSLSGIEGTLVEVEAEASAGLPAFHLVGLPDSSMLQARDRVRSALQQIGHRLPERRLTVNMTPAYLPKQGSMHDLGIAVAILCATGAVASNQAAATVHLGELGLDGRLRPVPGILPAVLAASRLGIARCVVARENASEAGLVPGIDVVAADDLGEVVRSYGGHARQLTIPRHQVMRSSAAQSAPAGRHDTRREEGSEGGSKAGAPQGGAEPDFGDVLGQHHARRAAEVAAAGGHPLVLCGSPGTGKTMIASRLPGILPDLGHEDAVQVSAVHSLSGQFNAERGLLRRPQFEAPHHTATVAAIIGGGSGMPRPGAISRAHAGVLFLDEAPEFSPRVLDALREPLETGDITVHRAHRVTRYPARFQLVMAHNPCPCGYASGHGTRCTCTPMARRRYTSRISGPILDRIDIRCELPPVQPGAVTGATAGEPSVRIAERVRDARARQAARLRSYPYSLNAQVPGPVLRRDFPLDSRAINLLERALAECRLTMRGYARVLRLAWTLADLDGAAYPSLDHVGLALTLRGTDRR